MRSRKTSVRSLSSLIENSKCGVVGAGFQPARLYRQAIIPAAAKAWRPIAIIQCGQLAPRDGVGLGNVRGPETITSGQQAGRAANRRARLGTTLCAGAANDPRSGHDARTTRSPNAWGVPGMGA